MVSGRTDIKMLVLKAPSKNPQRQCEQHGAYEPGDEGDHGIDSQPCQRKETHAMQAHLMIW
jgi:hypothetical protein